MPLSRRLILAMPALAAAPALAQSADPRMAERGTGRPDAPLTVHEFFLTARRNELERRITGQVLFADDPARDEAARQWRLAQLDAAAASLAGLEPKPRILDTTSVSPAEVADAIVEELLVGS